jgi:hypothetical protein
MDDSIMVFNPVAPSLSNPQQVRATLNSLKGKVIGFIDNGKPNFNYLVDDLARLLIDEYGVAAAIKRRKRGPSVPAPESMMKELVEQCDAVIAGSGD